MQKKKKKIYIYIYKSLYPPKRLGVSEAVHIALEACIYRLSNVGPYFINCVVDSKNYGPNWALCRDIARFVATELSAFIAAFVVASCFLS